MIGLIVKYMDKIYKVGTPGEGEFILEAGGMQHGFVGIFRNLREGIEFEVEVAEFDKASEPLSETNQPIIDPDYPREEDPDWKLKHFRKLEKILKEEGLLD